MASQVFEEPLELQIGLLEAGPPTLDSYPYPSLSNSGSVQTRTFRAVILENPYLRATFVPALGGRLLALTDKRTGTEIFPSSLPFRSDGQRGVELQAGLELHLDGRRRLTSLAAVQYAAEEPDEEHPASLWLGEAVTGTGLSWHLHITLPPDQAELQIEARIFNRTYEERPYNGGLLMPSLGENRTNGKAYLNGDRLALIPEKGLSASEGGADLMLSRFDEWRRFAPRQLDSWRVSLIPCSGLTEVSAVSKAGSISVGSQSLQIQAATPMRQHKLVLLTTDGRTLEAPVDLYPEKIEQVSLPGPIRAVAVVSPTKEVVLEWDGEWQKVPGSVPGTAQFKPQNMPEDLEEATFDVGTRHIAYALLGSRALAQGAFEEADERFEQSLLYNGDDHLTWWMKALAKRLDGKGEGETPELLNAHFLAPLEPALRAESFLTQPRTLDKEPSALLKPMAEYPESFIEVASLLVEAELYEQASRWIDEALRHADLAMLRYLLAYIHLKASGMDFEVADQVRLAGKLPLAPPYPWRAIEKDAISALAERFAEDARLQALKALIAC